MQRLACFAPASILFTILLLATSERVRRLASCALNMSDKLRAGKPDFDERLIAAVKKRRPLWDPTTPLHRNVQVLVYLWQQVAKELATEVAILKRKWKSLKDYFTKLMLEHPTLLVSKRGDAIECSTTTKWPLFDKLSFLAEHKIARSKNHSSRLSRTAQDREILKQVAAAKKRGREEWESFIDKITSERYTSCDSHELDKNRPAPSEKDLLASLSFSSTTCDTQQSKKNDLPPVDKGLVTSLGFSSSSRDPQQLNKNSPMVANLSANLDFSTSSPDPQQSIKNGPPPLENNFFASFSVIDRPLVQPSLRTILPRLAPKPPPQSVPQSIPKTLNSTRKALHPRPPLKKLKRTPVKDKDTQTERTIDNDSEADLQFFKSLLPFMNGFSLKQNLRVRNEIQHLILGHLESVGRNAEHKESVENHISASELNTVAQTPEEFIDLESSNESITVSPIPPDIKMETDVEDMVLDIKGEPEIE